jgi:hypothetical protein
MSKKRFPNNRMSKFFDDAELQYEIENGREFIEGDLNMTVVLYSIDTINSKTHELYGESLAEDMVFKVPVELKVKVVLEQPKNFAYEKDMFRTHEYGNLTFEIFQEQLDELNVDIKYGDFIGYSDFEDNIKFFQVVNDGKIFSNNENTFMSYKGYYRNIICAPADKNQFNIKF